MSEADELAEACDGLAELTVRARAWVEDSENTDLVGVERKSLQRLLQRSRRRASKLGRSAQTRMSVTVFGPSQAGKSFLSSVLARPADGPLLADFHGAGRRIDYIREINPEGEGESTGLVTRFTVVKDPCPEGFPVRLMLLSEADAVRTIINSFFMDGDQSAEMPPEGDKIGTRLEAMRSRAGSPVPGITSDDIHEIGDYVRKTFGKTAYAAALEPFWDDAADLLPRLSHTDRSEVFGLLWGDHKPLNALYLQLAKALAALDGADEVYAPLDALIPRDSSLIDVKTLRLLSNPEADGRLRLRTPSGREAELPRAMICALAAELVLPMAEQPTEFFAETDLLDFPGARNRFDKPLVKTLEEPERTVPELLLRGKVAYLFDRYVENQEITAMLLCIPDSNMETVDLPPLIDNWIARTHGSSEAERERTECLLFFVLTKFDKHLSDSAASSGDDYTRFDRRIFASLLEKFGRGLDPWVSQWTPGKPFDNCLWLRNPNFYVEGLIEYDTGTNREQRVVPGKEARLAELRAGCLSAENVKRHFADPEAAWDAALTLNDGGVGYMREKLTRVCRPDSKLNQIRSQLLSLRSELRAALQPFYTSDDVEARIAEKQDAASATIDMLDVTRSQHNFGALLREMMVDQNAIEDRIGRVPSSIRIGSAVSGAQAGAARPAAPGGGSAPSPARPGRPPRPGAPATPRPVAAVATAPAARQTAELRTLTLEEFQADTAMEIWIENLKAFGQDHARLSRWGLEPNRAAEMAGEIIHAARRTRLSRRIAEGLAEINFGLSVDRQARPAAMLSAEKINDFVWTLGMTALPLDKRPTVDFGDNDVRPVFAPRPPRDSVEDLPLQMTNVADERWSEWVFSLYSLYESNAKDTAGGSVNIEQNMRIGQILKGFEMETAA